MKLEGKWISRSELTASVQDAMFRLMERYYDNLRRSTFEADLSEKDGVIVMVDPVTGELAGFSTQMVMSVDIDGRLVRALFSGDTIVEPARWNESVLAEAGGRLALSIMERYGEDELYWFLISKGYKTYRFLPIFFHDFYPRFDRPTPPAIQTVIDALARSKFSASYDPVRGVIPANVQKDFLRPGVAALTPERLRDPHIRFFAQRNPGHAHGDELCCLAPLRRANFTAAADRVLRRQLVDIVP